MRLAITEGSNELRRLALRALESRVPAQLATLVEDSVLSVEAADTMATVRTMTFAADHRCTLSVQSSAGDLLSVEFHTDQGTALDIELWQTSEPNQTIRSVPAEPARFDEVHTGPMRIVYSVPDGAGSPRRYQTEWVLLP